MNSEDYMVKYINEFRIALGLGKLRTDQSLTAAAGLHARYLAREGKLTHTGKSGGPVDRAKECGFVAKLIAENVALATFGGPKTIFDGWCGSREHRINMLLKDAKGIGVATATVNGVDYWVALFGTREKLTRT